MSVTIDFNDYKKGNIKQWILEEASKNLPKELLLEIGNKTKDSKSVPNEDFELILIPRNLNESWKDNSRNKYIREYHLTNWYMNREKSSKVDKNGIHTFKETSIFFLDKVPEEINFLDFLLSKNFYNGEDYFEKIFLNFMTVDKYIEFQYFYDIEEDFTCAMFLGTLAKTDSEEWKFYPKFQELRLTDIMIKI